MGTDMSNAIAEHMKRVSQQAMDAMARYGVAPHPRNYALWFAYFDGNAPDLSDAIDELLLSDKAFTEARCARLINDFLRPANLDCACPLSKAFVPPSVKDAIEAISPSCCATEQSPKQDTAFWEASIRPRMMDLVLLSSRVAQDRYETMPSPNPAWESRLCPECQELIDHLIALRKLGELDSATGLISRDVFQVMVRETILLTKQTSMKLSVMLLSVDNLDAFEKIDEATGDAVLGLLARALREQVKAEDTVCRFGQSMFAVLMPHTELFSAQDVAEAVYSSLAERTIYDRRGQDNLGHMELSISVAQYHDGETEAQFLRRAAEAIFTAKAKTSKNSVQAL